MKKLFSKKSVMSFPLILGFFSATGHAEEKAPVGKRELSQARMAYDYLRQNLDYFRDNSFVPSSEENLQICFEIGQANSKYGAAFEVITLSRNEGNAKSAEVYRRAFADPVKNDLLEKIASFCRQSEDPKEKNPDFSNREALEIRAEKMTENLLKGERYLNGADDKNQVR